MGDLDYTYDSMSLERIAGDELNDATIVPGGFDLCTGAWSANYMDERLHPRPNLPLNLRLANGLGGPRQRYELLGFGSQASSMPSTPSTMDFGGIDSSP